jgi:hypothetical protein
LRESYQRRRGVGPHHRRDKAIAAPGDGLDAALRSRLVEGSTKRCDLSALMVQPPGASVFVSFSKIYKFLSPPHIATAVSARHDRRRHRRSALRRRVLGWQLCSSGSDETRPAPRLSIVVLPFAELSAARDHQYFADGVTEDLTTDLSRMAAHS